MLFYFLLNDTLFFLLMGPAHIESVQGPEFVTMAVVSNIGAHYKTNQGNNYINLLHRPGVLIVNSDEASQKLREKVFVF